MEYKLKLNGILEMTASGIEAVRQIVNMAYMADQLETWSIEYDGFRKLSGAGINATAQLGECITVYNLK